MPYDPIKYARTTMELYRSGRKQEAYAHFLNDPMIAFKSRWTFEKFCAGMDRNWKLQQQNRETEELDGTLTQD